MVFKIPPRLVTYLFISRRAATAKRKGVTRVAIMLCFQTLFQNKHGLNLCFSLPLNINVHGDYTTKGTGDSSAGSPLVSDTGARKLWVMGTSLPEPAARWGLQSQEQPGGFPLPSGDSPEGEHLVMRKGLCAETRWVTTTA